MGRTDDDDSSVFDLLQSVDNWQSLKTFVRYNSAPQLKGNGDEDDDDVVRLADVTPPASPKRVRPLRPTKHADAASRPRVGELAAVARTFQNHPPPPPLTWGLLGHKNRSHCTSDAHQRQHSNNMDLSKSISLAIKKGDGP